MKKWNYARLNYWRATYPGIIGVGKSEHSSLDFVIYGQKDSYKEYGIEQTADLIAWLGNNGWEMVNVTYACEYNRSENYIDEWQKYFFKRPQEE